jgi:hypothetical protein
MNQMRDTDEFPKNNNHPHSSYRIEILNDSILCRRKVAYIVYENMKSVKSSHVQAIGSQTPHHDIIKRNGRLSAEQRQIVIIAISTNAYFANAKPPSGMQITRCD